MNSASSNLLEILSCEDSLYTFVQKAWPAIEGNNPFIPNWHIEAICEHLEAAIRQEIKNLIISVPPRTSKTTIISIMWPAWVWIKMPHIKFLFSSYAQKISWEHSRLCKMLIESAWYQERWGHVVQLSKDQVTKGHFTNTATGHRIATSVGAGGTALGGDILVCLSTNSIIETSAGPLTIGDIVECELDVMVKSYNHLSNSIELRKIEAHEKRFSEEIYEIEFDDGSILECTGNHPIFISNEGGRAHKSYGQLMYYGRSRELFGDYKSEGYIKAEDITEGDVVWSIERNTGESVII